MVGTVDPALPESDVSVNLRSTTSRRTIFGTSTIFRRRVTGFFEVTSTGLKPRAVEAKPTDQKQKQLTHSYPTVSQCRSWVCCSTPACVRSVCFPCPLPKLAQAPNPTLNFRLQSRSGFLQPEPWREHVAHVVEHRAVTKPSLEEVRSEAVPLTHRLSYCLVRSPKGSTVNHEFGETGEGRTISSRSDVPLCEA